MYRMITEFLEACKESEHRKPLILHGARLPKASAVRTIKKLFFSMPHFVSDIICR